MYKIPDEYYIRLHHCRPRFKGDIENVLIYMAEEISKLPELPCGEYENKINQAIRCFPGNINKTLKTINNWRTEISSLFGFIQNDGINCKAGLRAKELAEKQDLVECFKMFLYNFQYPGAHIKSHEILKLIEAGVSFKPAQYLLKILKYAEDSTGKRQYITKAEFCHCIFNDLRCVRDKEDFSLTWNRIISNRDNETEYEQAGDIIRYAGDIIDYMEIANLLVTHDGYNFYINTLENAAVLKFIKSNDWFSDYDSMIEKRSATLEEINGCKEHWFEYVNRDIADSVFETDVLAFISSDETEYKELQKQSLNLYDEKLADAEKLRTKDIGDIGESLVFGHECQRIKTGGREDLIHLIKRIPTQLAVGYDIQSVELDERKRYIEVKSTISSKPLHFNKIHLTPNEWGTAQSVHDRYFVYRLMISKSEKKLYILQDPVRLYKNDLIDMSIKDGAEITFYPQKSGNYEELLAWKG